MQSTFSKFATGKGKNILVFSKCFKKLHMGEFKSWVNEEKLTWKHFMRQK